MAPKDVISSVFSAFERGDVPHIINQVAPDAVWKQSSLLPWGGDYRGPEGAAEFFTRLDQAMETTAFRADEIIEVGDQVFTFGWYEGRSRATGRKGGSRWMFRWRVSDGKIVLYDAYIDTAALLAALQ